MSMIRFRSIRLQGRKGEPRRGWLARCSLIGLSLFVSQMIALEPAQAQTVNTYKQYTFIQLNHSFKEFYCVSDLWFKESRWQPTAKNSKSSAYGIPQLLNLKSKDPFIQIDRGLDYIKNRYTTPCNALAFHNKRGWY
jgi:hypothetical protein